MSEYAIGIDLGGSSVKAVAARAEGNILAKHTVAFQDDGQMDWAAKISSLVEQLKRAGETPRIGLSAPGLAARDARSIAYMPGRLRGLQGLDWTTHLKSHTPVPVLNDAQAALLGEVWLGAGKSLINVIMLTLGTGVGGAAMVDGRLLHGHIGRAGHLGHMSLDPDGTLDVTGTPGSLEAVIGNYTIQERTGGRFATTHDLVAAHLKGEPEATAIWLKSVKGLAAAIASFINILDPEAVIVGGGIARAGETLFTPLREYLKTMEWQPGGHQARIVPAQLGEFAGAIGAARNALTSAP